MVDCKQCNGACCRWAFCRYEEEIKDVMIYRGCVIVEINKELFFAHRMKCRKLLTDGKCSIYRTRSGFCRTGCIAGDTICLLARELEKNIK